MGEIIPSDAVRAIQDSVQAQAIEIRGQSYVTRPVHLPPYEPLPDTLLVHTLSGVAIFCNSFPKKDVAFIHVDSASTVYVLGHLNEQSQKRPYYLKATLFRDRQFKFNTGLGQEEFIIGLQTAFTETANQRLLRRIAGGIEKDANVRLADDGISQKITTRQGASLSSETEFQNPVWLAPFRTFPEIEQPESPYAFRVNGDGSLALHETLETEWQIKAITLIKDFLAERVSDVTILH